MKFIIKTNAENNDEEMYASLYLAPDAKTELLNFKKRLDAFADNYSSLHSMQFWGTCAGMVAFLKNFDPHVELNSDQRVHLENHGWVRLPNDYRMEAGEAYAFPNYFHIDRRFFWWSGIPRGTDLRLNTDGAPWEMLTCPIHGEDDSLEATCLHCVAMSY